MTKQEINLLIKMINAYYPYKKILEDELDLLVWRKAFENYDKDLTVKATEQLCNEDITGAKVNIAGIKQRVKELEEEREKQDHFAKQQKEIQDNLNFKASEYTKNKLKEICKKFTKQKGD